MARLGDYIREECRPVGAESDKFSLVGVSNEHGLVSSPREMAADNLSRYQRVERNWFAYNPMRVNVGSIGLADDDSKTGITSPDYVVFSCREGLDPRFLLHFLKSDYGLEAIARNCSGAVRKRLYYSGLAEIELTIPDIERQQALITRIEHIQRAIRFIRDENSDCHELPKLKQAILQEAVAGKLTADWRAAHPDVEPASKLFHRIQSEKARLIVDRKLRSEKPLPPINPAATPFNIPQSWEWCRLGNIYPSTSGGTPSRANPRFWDGKIPWLKSGEMTDTYITEWPEEFITDDGRKNSSVTLFPEGTLLIAMYGATAGKLGILTYSSTTNQAVCGMFTHVFTNTRFVFFYLLSRRSQMIEESWGNSQPNISQGYLRNYVFPLPPLAEQAVIVERVEALMADYRTLATEIEQTRTQSAHLLQAALKEAFAPTSNGM